jgi:non-heme chloroperoxidase
VAAAPLMPEGRELTVRTDDDAELAVLDAGPEDGVPVVLAHCWMGTSALWAAVARRLVRTGHRVIVYDQRGHGRSTFGDGVPDVDRLGRDLKAVLDHLGVRDPVLAGHSMGGMTIVAFAARYPAQAAATRALVLVSTAVRVLGRPLPPALVRGVFGRRSPLSGGGRLGSLVVRPAFGRTADRADLRLVYDCLSATPGAVSASCMRAMGAMDLRAGIAPTSVPTTIVVGSRDLLTPPWLARGVARCIPGARLHIVPGGGHMLPLEHPDRITDLIARAAAGGGTAAAALHGLTPAS